MMPMKRFETAALLNTRRFMRAIRVDVGLLFMPGPKNTQVKEQDKGVKHIVRVVQIEGAYQRDAHLLWLGTISARALPFRTVFRIEIEIRIAYGAGYDASLLLQVLLLMLLLLLLIVVLILRLIWLVPMMRLI